MNFFAKIKKLKYFELVYLFRNKGIIINKYGGKLSIHRKASLKYSIIKIGANCLLNIDEDVRIISSKIIIQDNSSLEVGKNSFLNEMNISILGSVSIGSNNYIGHKNAIWIIQNGILNIGNNNRLKNTIWIRFGGKMTIGQYNAINENSEIRCDENVEIGNYNEISMNVRIWDTNTHRILCSSTEFMDYRINHFPFFNEEIKPLTTPVFIGDCNWLGEFCAILKGCRIQNHCILGFHTILCNRNIDDNNIVVTDLSYKMKTY